MYLDKIFTHPFVLTVHESKSDSQLEDDCHLSFVEPTTLGRI